MNEKVINKAIMIRRIGLLFMFLPYILLTACLLIDNYPDCILILFALSFVIGSNIMFWCNKKIKGDYFYHLFKDHTGKSGLRFYIGEQIFFAILLVVSIIGTIMALR